MPFKKGEIVTVSSSNDKSVLLLESKVLADSFYVDGNEYVRVHGVAVPVLAERLKHIGVNSETS